MPISATFITDVYICSVSIEHTGPEFSVVLSSSDTRSTLRADCIRPKKRTLGEILVQYRTSKTEGETKVALNLLCGFPFLGCSGGQNSPSHNLNSLPCPHYNPPSPTTLVCPLRWDLQTPRLSSCTGKFFPDWIWAF